MNRIIYNQDNGVVAVIIPTPESYSQMYHQVYAIPTNPFYQYKNFYRFCDDYVKVAERKINGLMIKDYSGGKETILDEMRPYKPLVM